MDLRIDAAGIPGRGGEQSQLFYERPNHLDLPSDRLTWNQASNYCALLSRRERQAGRLPEGYTYRLPTEAEWEYACRAGTTNSVLLRRLSGLLESPEHHPLGEHSWYYQNSKRRCILRGEASKPWGIYDLYGNVCEWVIDHAAPYPGGHVTNYVATSAINIRGETFTNAGSGSVVHDVDLSVRQLERYRPSGPGIVGADRGVNHVLAKSPD